MKVYKALSAEEQVTLQEEHESLQDMMADLYYIINAYGYSCEYDPSSIVGFIEDVFKDHCECAEKLLEIQKVLDKLVYPKN